MCVFACVCVPAAVPTCALTHLGASSVCVFVCFARVGAWMSVCTSLCCHICCYQGNPVGRRRSAERYTAWRRETCGAQPVAGKKPVRDSPTNPVPFSCLRDELFLTQSDSKVDSSTGEMRGDFFMMELSVLLPSAQQGFCLLSFPFPNTKRK